MQFKFYWPLWLLIILLLFSAGGTIGAYLALSTPRLSRITKAGLIAFILNVTMMIVAFYIAKYFATGVAQRRCISLEAGLQNGTLAVFVGIQLFGTNMTYMVPTAAYALIMMMTSVIFVLILRRQT